MRERTWPIFVLSLESEFERSAPLLRSLQDMNLEYHVIYGVDARKQFPEELENQVDRVTAAERLGRPITDGELACALSHRKIYNLIEAEEHPGAVILEDDAILDGRFADFYQRAVYSTAEMLLLYHSHARVWRERTEIMTGVAKRTLSLPPSGTVAYSVTASAARRLISASTPVTYVADWPYDISKLDACITDPPIVGHPPLVHDVSLLHAERYAASSLSKSGIAGATRFFSKAFWKRWITKRLSVRVS